MSTCTALTCRDNFQVAFDDLLAEEPKRQMDAIVKQHEKARWKRMMRAFSEMGGWAQVDMGGMMRAQPMIVAEPMPQPAPQVFYADLVQLERQCIQAVGIPPHFMPQAPRRISTADDTRDALVGAAYAAEAVADVTLARTWGIDLAKAEERDHTAMVLTVIKSRKGVPNKNNRVYNVAGTITGRSHGRG